MKHPLTHKTLGTSLTASSSRCTRYLFLSSPQSLAPATLNSSVNMLETGEQALFHMVYFYRGDIETAKAQTLTLFKIDFQSNIFLIIYGYNHKRFTNVEK